ncbi:uncharacterized protein LOC143371011, partial [Andrena cerasifolii]|uniref:uncharacterized protein LOC143371011 n=1 Tax=Andrena cerasifolii TaxID=2819439 RepID=UPI004037884D
MMYSRSEQGASMKHALFLVSSVLLPPILCQRFTQTVYTDTGRVRGRRLQTGLHSMPYSAFMGIPFAKPPVGDLRFRDPIEADPWTGVLNATDEAPACIQHVAIRTIGQEDCLYLNVYTKVTDFTIITTEMPVMVWFYGGAFIVGMIWREIYGPDFFLEEGVILVAVNYRLGPFGSLGVGVDEGRGNQALKDQQLALQWVQRNIGKFGGDRNRVTIFGESAGSVSTLYHLLSPKSTSLFHQAIAQSGSPLCTWGYNTPAQSLQVAYELGERVGIKAHTPQQLLDSLKVADAGKIARVGFYMTSLLLPLPIRVPFTATTDAIPSDPSPEKVFFDGCPLSKFQSGNFNHVPTMLGYNKDEGILFIIVLELLRQVVFNVLSQISSTLDIIGVSKDLLNIVNRGVTGVISTLIKVTTIYFFSHPIDVTQKYLAKHNGDIPVYYYRLSYSTERSLHKLYNPQINGTAHIDDIGLLFYIGLLSPIDPDTPYNQYRKKLVSLWTNFAKYGNPTPNNQPINGAVWLPSGKAGLQLDIGNEQFQMHDRLLNKVAEDFEPVYITLLKFQSNCGKGTSNLLQYITSGVYKPDYQLHYMCWISDCHAEIASMKPALFLVSSVLLPPILCQKFTQTVDTDKGRVRGRTLETGLRSIPYSAFMAIPFAKPPVGDLRFRDPIEADPWTGVLNATDEPPACIQHVFIRTIGQEDCLYLNVYTGVTDFRNITTLKPVMVWIYGGAFIWGTVWHQLYGPDFFVEDDVILVAMNYRLGTFGFLGMGLDGARGNQALKDQNLALQWVQKNIANFGGDPNRVTLFGQSAGSVSTMYHLLSPKSQGLFHQAIAQSGSPLCTWGYNTPAQSLQVAYELGERVGIKAHTPEQLLDSLKLADAVKIARVGFYMSNLLLPLPIKVPFTATTDAIPSDPSPEKVFFDGCPLSKFQSGNFSHVPIMLGYNKDEAILATTAMELIRQVVYDILNQINIRGLTKNFISVANRVARGIISTLIQVTTIYFFTHPIDVTQKYLAKHNGDIPVYYYRLSYSTERSFHKLLNPRINGTSHNDDLGLLFYAGLLSPIDPDTPYNQYRKKLVSLWTNFAKYGNPTPNNQPINGAVWLPSGKAGLQLDIGNEQFQMHDCLLDQIIQDLEPLYIKLLKFRSDCAKGS